MQESPLSKIPVNQVIEALDYSPVAIIISAVDNQELLYVNKKAEEQFLISGCEKKFTCYQTIGFDKPCTFCNVKKLNISDYYVREYIYPRTQHVYQLSGRIIDWEGRKAHIEYILDITQERRKKEQIEEMKDELQEVLSNIPCGMGVYSYDGKQVSPVSHNSTFYEIMGYSEEHIKSVEHETSFLGVHPEDLSYFQEKVEETLNKRDSFSHTYRVWHDKKQEYRFIHIEACIKTREDGTRLIYCVYVDVSEQMRMKKEIVESNEKMQDIINAIPGGVVIYQFSDFFETVYFSGGIPEFFGYSAEEYKELCKQDIKQMVYAEDWDLVERKVKEAIKSRQTVELEYRRHHKDGHIVWVRVLMKRISGKDGCPLLHCVFHNISSFKGVQLEMNHLINSMPGGIISYAVEGNRFISTYYSDGVPLLSGHTRQEYEEMNFNDALDIVYEQDRERVARKAFAALESGKVLDVCYRIRHKNGRLVWVRLYGQRMDLLQLPGTRKFYAVLTGISDENRMLRNIINDISEGIYVISKENYELLYINEPSKLFGRDIDCTGQKCYTALYGNSSPCEFCTLNTHEADGKEHEMACGLENHFYHTRFREVDWNGIPAYMKYIRDVTEEVHAKKGKEYYEKYFQTVINNLSGGVAVISREQDGTVVPEFLSDGFAIMTGMTQEEAWQLYCRDAMTGVHPDDREKVNIQLKSYIERGERQCDMSYRLLKGDGSYIWIKSVYTIIQNEDGASKIYVSYNDITEEHENQEQIRRQYNELIIQHYLAPGPNELIAGHCNITKNRILEIMDYVDSGIEEAFGDVREGFFTGISGLIADERERKIFLETYLNEPSLAAYERGATEIITNCYIQLPKEENGRYVQFKMNLVKAPDMEDITGILTVTDVTEQTVSDMILHQLSVANYDLVVDVDLQKEQYAIFTGKDYKGENKEQWRINLEKAESIIKEQMLTEGNDYAGGMLSAEYMLKRLKNEGSYSFSYTITNEKRELLTKNVLVSAIDLRIGRVCLARTDITESVKEQQRFLNVIAYTFELLSLVNVKTKELMIYNRQIVLERLSPLRINNYDEVIDKFIRFFDPDANRQAVRTLFDMESMVKRLEKEPAGYDFVIPHQSEAGLRYKQINVLWGDREHTTVCMVRADVTDMLESERKLNSALEKALTQAEKAGQAKSAFLFSMSHDIRTPMNAIMGMTTLALNHLEEKERVKDCLEKISFSSRHLLNLINDILDMSQIERSKITLNCTRVYIPEQKDKFSAMVAPQAEAAGIQFNFRSKNITHQYFFGDTLRINQVLINIIGNAVKFTPRGGRIEMLIEELPAEKTGAYVKYRFTVSDTGIGISNSFLEKIFEPFVRTNDTMVEGTGLGLSITKGLVDLMGGTISVESQKNVGSTFRVELEFEEAPEEADEEEKKKEAVFNTSDNEKVFLGKRFLMAEDNLINSEIVNEFLKMFGAEVEIRTDGVQTVQAFANAKPGTFDAVLMDIQMPNMNGYEATRTIRGMKREDAKTIPIIAMTANAFVEDVRDAMEAGMTAHIAKPIDIRVLCETLNKILSAAQ